MVWLANCWAAREWRVLDLCRIQMKRAAERRPDEWTARAYYGPADPSASGGGAKYSN